MALRRYPMPTSVILLPFKLNATKPSEKTKSLSSLCFAVSILDIAVVCDRNVTFQNNVSKIAS